METRKENFAKVSRHVDTGMSLRDERKKRLKVFPASPYARAVSWLSSANQSISSDNKNGIKLRAPNPIKDNTNIFGITYQLAWTKARNKEGFFFVSSFAHVRSRRGADTFERFDLIGMGT